MDDAEDAGEVLFADDPSNPGLQLGAALGGTSPLRDKLVVADAYSPLVGLGAWIEQLIAESTGKQGTGVLPIIVADGEPELSRDADDVLVTEIVDADADESSSVDGDEADTVVSPHVIRTGGSLGSQFLLWETATAVAGSLLSLNPFDQPDVESAKNAARGLLDGGLPEPEKAAVDGAVEIRSSGSDSLLSEDSPGLTAALKALLEQIPASGYLAVMAYADRTSEKSSKRSVRSSRPPPGGPSASGGDPASCTPRDSFTRADPTWAPSFRSQPPPTLTLTSPTGPSASASSSRHRLKATPRCSLVMECPSCSSTSLTAGQESPSCSRQLRHYEHSRRRTDTRERTRQHTGLPCAVVMFGVTGDLARKKLLPAIYDLANRGLLPPGFSLVGYGRRGWSHEDFADEVETHVRA